MDGIELVSFKIISNVGAAKSSYIEAMRAADAQDFNRVDELMKQGDENFLLGHEAHAELIQKEAAGQAVQVNLLLMHAEDQLISTETIKILVKEMIQLNKKIHLLEANNKKGEE